MSLKQIKTNRRLAEQLSAILGSGKVVHAFLIAGGDSDERTELGMEFAKALLCAEMPGDSCGECLSCRKFDDGNHEDFIRVGRMSGKQSIVSDQIEELRNMLKFKPLGARNVVLIDDAGSMNAISQNKLLKCLEEPVSETVMILLASGRDELLQTVVSRSTSPLKSAALSFGVIRGGTATNIICDEVKLTGTLRTEKVFITASDTGKVNVPKTITGGRCEITTATGNIEIEVK